MRWLRTLLPLGLVALFAVTAFAEYGVLDKGTHYVDPQGARVNSSGARYVDDVNHGAWALFPNIIANQLAASGAGLQDSSQAQATYPYSRLALYLTPQFDSLSTVVRLAVQVRGHFSTAVDSGNTFPWHRWPFKSSGSSSVTVGSVVAAAGNTVLHTAAAAASVGLFSSVGIGWRVTGPGIAYGTYVISKGTSDSALTISTGTTAIIPANSSVTFHPPGALESNFGQADSLGDMYRGISALAQATAANAPFAGSNGLWPGEFEVKFDVARNDSSGAGEGKFGAYPKTQCILLQDPNGSWFSAPYTSVRVRVINGVRSRFNLKVDLVGMK